MADIAPFKLVETSPGKFSLLLTEFSPADQAFEAVGNEGGGYAWAAIARHLVENDSGLEEHIGLDPEGSMFCAYGTDREALLSLGRHLARLFHDRAALEQAITDVGPENLDD